MCGPPNHRSFFCPAWPALFNCLHAGLGCETHTADADPEIGAGAASRPNNAAGPFLSHAAMMKAAPQATIQALILHNNSIQQVWTCRYLNLVLAIRYDDVGPVMHTHHSFCPGL